MSYRNKKVLAHANGQECQMCGINDGTVVAAHSNQGRHGKGMGMKAHDAFVAYLCNICHHQIDQGFLFTRGEKQQLWESAFLKSVPLYWELLDEEGKKLVKEMGYGE